MSADERDANIRQLGLDPQKPTVLVGVPGEYTSLSVTHHSSFEVAKTFIDVRALQSSIPDLQIIFKFRPRGASPHHRAYLQELFGEGRMAIAEYEDLFSMLQLADIVLSPNSSVIYEAILAQKPVVLFPWKLSDAHHAIYAEGALATDSKVLMTSLIQKLLQDKRFYIESQEKGQLFLKKYYSFDGHASERIVDLLRRNLKTYN